VQRVLRLQRTFSWSYVSTNNGSDIEADSFTNVQANCSSDIVSYLKANIGTNSRPTSKHVFLAILEVPSESFDAASAPSQLLCVANVHLVLVQVLNTI
jgi:hypothetical protein